MSGFGFNQNASARVADGRLIMSMPDAETPVVWMMNLTDAMTSVLRLEMDRQGFFVIRRHGGKGAAETIAVYRDRKPAVQALARASRALEKARNTGLGAATPSTSRIKRFFTYLLVIWFILYVFGLDGVILRRILTLPPETKAVSVNPNAVGVPLSADDFLKEQTMTMP